MREQAVHYTRTPDGALIGQRNADTAGRLYYHLDALGSVISVTDSAGTRVGDYNYDPYGGAVSTTGTDVAFRYAGQYRTTSLALYKMGMRYYDMKIGRWTQQDPLDQTGDLREGNRYMYVGGNPVNNVDPTGQFLCLVVRECRNRIYKPVARATSGAIVKSVRNPFTPVCYVYKSFIQKGDTNSFRDDTMDLVKCTPVGFLVDNAD